MQLYCKHNSAMAILSTQFLNDFILEVNKNQFLNSVFKLIYTCI